MTHRACAVVAWLVVTAPCACDRQNGESPAASAASASKGMSTGTRDSVTRDSSARAQQDSINRSLPGYVIDSILPVEEQLRRFRAKLGGAPVTGLLQASHSRDELVERFINALVAGDSTELRLMAVTAREFADLVYPESPNTAPPYQQDPGLVWRTIQNPSESGFIRLVRRAGGVPVRLTSYRCNPIPARQGSNTLWTGCELALVGPQGDTSTHRFFGTILERKGRFKFMSYKNEF